MSGVEVVSGPQSQTLEGAKGWLRHHLEIGRYPMNFADRAAAVRTIDGLSGIDPQSWSAGWLGTAGEFAARARDLEGGGERRAARAAWWEAYQFAFLGRYPVPNHPAKAAAYDKAREYFLRATSLDDPPVERVVVPFGGRAGEGDYVAFYLTRPAGVSNPPVLIHWSGIDGWKEESHNGLQRYWQRGIATICTDIPGTGEAPVLAGVDGERMWDPVLDWIAGSDLDASRVAVMGQSYGGYWATKLAHTRRDRLVAAVNHGGGIHLTFQPSWQQRSRNASSYLMDLMGTRARLFGGTTFEDYVARCPELSLLDQGILDQRCCPLLLVNGKDDLQNASADTHLALEHGDPKTARLYPGGHMGADIGQVRDAAAAWLTTHLHPKTTPGNHP